jgi:nicotinamidase-related amidase
MERTDPVEGDHGNRMFRHFLTREAKLHWPDITEFCHSGHSSPACGKRIIGPSPIHRGMNMSQPAKRALIVIDLQNDYFPDGKFPLWNTGATLENIESAIAKANAQGIPVIIVQHVADSGKGIAPFFNEGTPGVDVHPRILAAAPGAPVVIKHFADSFVDTTLESTLSQLGVNELLVCGMMTQNCVTHTAISRSAEKYKVSILTDCCTTVNEMLHLIALNAVSTRLALVKASDVL